MVIFNESDYIAHYGTPRHSGRYPWGSGENPHQSSGSFLSYVAEMKEAGYSESQIIEDLGMTSTEFRQRRSIANAERKQADIARAQKLKDKGWSNSAIGREMGRNESSVRAMLSPGEKLKTDILNSTSEMLKDQLKSKRFLDVGAGVEHHLGMSKTKLGTAVKKLQDEGYTVHRVQVDQLGTGKKTTIKVLAPAGTEYRDIVTNLGDVEMIASYTVDGGRSWLGIKPPLEVNPNRVQVVWDEEGGSKADGVLYIRPGVDDLSLGKARYAQVRVKVGKDHYLKGMAVHKDNLPDGVDIQFNTNKSRNDNPLSAMKPIKDDPDNPFGSVIRQIEDDKGNIISAMNVVNDEGDWDNWSKNLSSQVLSKQNHDLAKRQLGLEYDKKKQELDDILALTNPTVRKKLLETYSDGADSSAVHLKAAAMPRQKTHVILPMNSMKETEVYAPNYRDGERVVLVRYPHGGIFEIPELTVNNRHAPAKKMIGPEGNVAIGINSKVAERLSGADFDGDTVLVIPNNDRKFKTEPPLQGLATFDAKREYAPYDGMKTVDGGIYNAKTGEVDYGDRKPNSRTMQREMGDVSNLITDMTIKGAPFNEIERAVRHSLVVIDSEKHHLDYRRSKRDNTIPMLKEKYQGKSNAGASTLISRASSEERVPDRRLRRASEGEPGNKGPVDTETGRLVWIDTGTGYERTKVNKRTGEETTEFIPKTISTTKGAATDDAYTLIDGKGTVIERVYADHSNKMKALANRARREGVRTPPLVKSPSARKAYAPQVEELSAALKRAESNAPLERRAQVLGGIVYRQKLDANPTMEASEKKKFKYLALEEARRRTGAGKDRVEITPKQWEAIQAGAISNHMLEKILNNADLDIVKEMATPRNTTALTPGKIARARAMLAQGLTQAEVADALGVSVSTITNNI